MRSTKDEVRIIGLATTVKQGGKTYTVFRPARDLAELEQLFTLRQTDAQPPKETPAGDLQP